MHLSYMKVCMQQTACLPAYLPHLEAWVHALPEERLDGVTGVSDQQHIPAAVQLVCITVPRTPLGFGSICATALSIPPVMGSAYIYGGQGTYTHTHIHTYTHTHKHTNTRTYVTQRSICWRTPLPPLGYGSAKSENSRCTHGYDTHPYKLHNIYTDRHIYLPALHVHVYGAHHVSVQIRQRRHHVVLARPDVQPICGQAGEHGEQHLLLPVLEAAGSVPTQHVLREPSSSACA